MKLTITKVSIPVLIMIIQSSYGMDVFEAFKEVNEDAYLIERGRGLEVLVNSFKSNPNLLYMSDGRKVTLDDIKPFLPDDKTKKEKIREAVADYLKSGFLDDHPITGLPEDEAELEGVIEKIAEYLVGKGNSDVYSSDILNDVLKLNNKQTNLNNKHLEALQGCLDSAGLNPSGNLKKTTSENVSEYLEKYNISSLPYETDEEKETAKDALCAVIGQIKALAEKAAEAAEEEKTVEVTTADYGEKKYVEFDRDELVNFVERMKEVDELPNNITVGETPTEQLIRESKEFLKDASHLLAKRPEENKTTPAYIVNVIQRANELAANTEDDPVKMTTDNISGFGWTFEELKDCVEHFQGKHEAHLEDVKEIDERIVVEKTPNEIIDEGIDAYIKEKGLNNSSRILKSALQEVATVLKNPVAWVVVAGAAAAVAALIIDWDEDDTEDKIIEFVNYLNAKGAVLNVPVNELREKIKEYYEPTNPDIEAHTVGNLTADDAYKLAMYMRNQTSATTITSESVKAIEGLSGASLTYDDLTAFVTYLNGKGENLPVTVARTEDEQIMYDIGEYRKDSANAIASNPSDEDLYKVVKQLQLQGENGVVTTSDIEDVEFKHSELVRFVNNFKGKDGIPSTITVVKTDPEKIDYAIAAYYPSHQIAGLTDAEAADALTKIAGYLKDLPPNTKIKSSTITDALKSGDSPIPAAVNLSHDDMEAFVAALNAEDFGLNVTIAEEELTIRQQIDELLADHIPEDKLADVVFDSYRLDSLLSKETIDGTDVKNTWADAITASFMPALSDANSGILKQDPNIPTVINNAAETETKSRIATTTDGTVPASLKSDIENYVNALYEARTTDMDTSLTSILSDENNNLSALNTTESKSAINSEILTDIKADGDAMTAKINSVYTDLPDIIDGVRRYAVMYDITTADIIEYYLENYTIDKDVFAHIFEYVFEKAKENNGRAYLRLLLRYWWNMDIDSSTVPAGAVDTILTNMKTQDFNAVVMPNVLLPHYLSYIKKPNTSPNDKVYHATLRAFWNTDMDGNVINLSSDQERVVFIWEQTYKTYPSYYLTISSADCQSILNYIKNNNKSQVLTILDNYIPSAATNDSSTFKEYVYARFLSDYNFYGNNMTATHVSDGYINRILTYFVENAWVPSIDIRDNVKPNYNACVRWTWTNTVAPSNINTLIQSSLANLGGAKTIKSGLLTQFCDTTFAALVHAGYPWPVANGASEIDDFKYTDTSDNKEKVNILDYTYSKLVGDILGIDAKTAYDRLKARADSINNSAIDTLVSSGLRDAMKSTVANVTTVDGVKGAANSVLMSNIMSQTTATSADVKDRYAKIYRSVNIDTNSVDLSGVSGVAGVNAAFDAAIFDTMNGYIYSDGSASGIFDGVTNGVTGFISTIYGTDEAAKRAAVRQVALNWITAQGEAFHAAEIAEKLTEIKECWTPEERIKRHIDSYLASHTVTGLPSDAAAAKDALWEITKYLQELGDATVRSSEVMAELNLPGVNLSHDELSDFVDYLKNEKGEALAVTIAKEESELRGEIDTILANYAPSEGSASFDSTLFDGLISDNDTIHSSDVQTSWKNAVADAFVDVLEDPSDATLWLQTPGMEANVNDWSGNAASAIQNSNIGTINSMLGTENQSGTIKSYLTAADETAANTQLSALLSNNNLSALGGETNLSGTRQAVEESISAAEDSRVDAVYGALGSAASRVLQYALSPAGSDEDLAEQIRNSSISDLKSYCKDYFLDGMAHAKEKKYVKDFYSQEGSPKVGNLNQDQAGKLLAYLEGQQPNYVSEDAALNYLINQGENLTSADLKYSDLSNFTSYLYRKKGLTINIERSQGSNGENQRIIDLILPYVDEGHANWSTPEDKKNEAIYIAKYLNKLNGMIRTGAEIISNLKSLGSSNEGISPQSTITHKDLVDLVEYLNKDHNGMVGGITVTITEERSAGEIAQIKTVISDYGSLNSMGLSQGQEINQAYSIVDHLGELNGMTRTSEAIIDYIKGRDTTLSTISITPEQLVNFMNYMKENGVDLTVEIISGEESSETLNKQYLSSYLQLAFYRKAQSDVLNTIYERIRDSYYEKQPYQGHYQSEEEKIDDTIKSTIGEGLLSMLISQVDPVNSYYNQSKPLLSKLDAYDSTKGASEKEELETHIKGLIIVMNYNAWAVVNAFSDSNNRPTKDEIKSIIQQYDNPPYVLSATGSHASCWDGVIDKMAQDLVQFGNPSCDSGEEGNPCCDETENKTSQDPSQIQSPSSLDVENIYKSRIIEHFYEHAWRMDQDTANLYNYWPDVVAYVKANSVVPATTDAKYATLIGNNLTAGTIKGYLAVRGDDSAKKTALDTLLSNSNLSLSALSQFAGHNDEISWVSQDGIIPDKDTSTVKTLDHTYSKIKGGVGPIDEQAVYDGLVARVPTVRKAALTEGSFLNSTQADTILEEVTSAETSATLKEKALTVLNTQNDLEKFVQIASSRTLGDHNVTVGSTVAGTQANIRDAISASMVSYLGQNVTLTDAQKDALIAAIDGFDSSASQTVKRSAILSYIPDISSEDLAAIVAKLTEIKEGM